MKIKLKVINAKGINFSLVEEEREIARAYLDLIHNDLHEEPFGLLEDVYVAANHRGRGLGLSLSSYKY